MHRRLLKLTNYLALIGFVGGPAASRVLADFTDKAPPSMLAGLGQSLAEVGETLGEQSRVALVQAFTAEQTGGAVTLVLAPLTVVLAARRPRLGGSVGRGPEESGWPHKLGPRLFCLLTLDRNRSAMTALEGGRDLRPRVCRVALAINQT